jgi:hypothetical protein
MVRALCAAVVVLAAGARAASSDLVGALRGKLDAWIDIVAQPVQGGCLLPAEPHVGCGTGVMSNHLTSPLNLTFCCWADSMMTGCSVVNGVVGGSIGCGDVTHSCASLPVCQVAPSSTARPSSFPTSPSSSPTSSPSGAAWLAPQVLGVLGALTVILV